MRNFLRVLRLALKDRLSLLCIFACSLMVAVLWGANISVVYPFVGIFFDGESMPVWIDGQVKERQLKTAQLRQTISRLEKRRRAVALRAQERDQLGRELTAAKQQLRTEAEWLDRARWLQPHVHRLLPRSKFATLLVVVGFLLACTLLKCIFLVISSVLVARLGERLKLKLRRTLFRSLIEMDIPRSKQQRTGKLISRITNEIGKVVNGVTTLVGQSVREPMKMIVCLIGAAVISWRLLLLTLIITPLAALLMIWLARLLRGANLQFMRDRAELINLLSEALSGLATVKAFNMEGHERARVHRSCQEMYKRSVWISWLNSLVSPNNEILGMSIVALAIVAGGYLVLNQETHLLGVKITDQPLESPGLVAFYAFVVGAADPIRKLSSVYGSLQVTFVAADRLYELYDAEPVVKDPSDPRSLPDARRPLVFENVDFHYERGLPILRDINLEIPVGETLAVVGPNGSGKSTLSNLILRFYDPANGAVRLGDLDLRDVRQRELRRHVGVVTQHTWLFDDTVMNNIRYGSAGATDAQVIEAAKLAHADQFITRELSSGYESHIGEHGGQLSGGQRQRIALARAILRDPDILILDEATSQIDLDSEQLIHQALRPFIQNRTTIIITHRLSTLELADRILVLEAGQTVALGTQAELLASCPHFRQLCQTDLKRSA